jgi:hypothetical protein
MEMETEMEAAVQTAATVNNEKDEKRWKRHKR